MIKKIIAIFLATSCFLLALAAVAESNTTTKASLAEVISKDKKSSIVDGSLSATTSLETPLGKTVPAKIASDNTIIKKAVKTSSVDSSTDRTADTLVKGTPQVGKHVMANMNAGSMILSLLMVLGLIVICAFVLKRFNLTQQSVSQLKVVTSLRLGTKERVMVVQVGEQQLLLGVTSQQITLLETLPETLPQQNNKAAELPKNILSLLSSKKA